MSGELLKESDDEKQDGGEERDDEKRRLTESPRGTIELQITATLRLRRGGGVEGGWSRII